MIKAVIFDFGGVLAEEGFREGLKAIAMKNGLNPDDFFKTAEHIIYETGYVTGIADESIFWRALREKTGIKGRDYELREEILKRFLLRPEMFKYVDNIRFAGLVAAILSDQTNWLDEINEKTPFYRYFDFIFNSYKIRKSKRDSSIFSEICLRIGVRPSETIFIDDNIRNINAAESEGLKTIHFINIADFEEKFKAVLKQEDL